MASSALSKSIYSQASKFKEIYQAESEMQKLVKEQEDLKSALEKQKSTFFLEKQARDKLGYQKPGEVLYVVLDQEDARLEQEKIAKENWQAWVYFLFR